MNIGTVVELTNGMYKIVHYDSGTDMYMLRGAPGVNPEVMMLPPFQLGQEVAEAQKRKTQPTYVTTKALIWDPNMLAQTGTVTSSNIQATYKSLQDYLDQEMLKNGIPPQGRTIEDDTMAYKALTKGDIIESTKDGRKWLVLERRADGNYNLQHDNKKIQWSHNDYEAAMRSKSIRVVRSKESVAKSLKLEELDKVVLRADAREDIVAVIMQAHRRDLIFDTWGLGETVEYGKGIGMLFYGGPGTGKTWAAHCIAKALGQELMVVTTGQIQSSLAGQTNKNIENAFKAAASGNHILFLDECDSFISDRKHLGMILSSEINTILTCIEKAEGITILATNKIESLDPALERRLALILDFPKPNLEQRVKIWQTIIPKKMPLGDGVSAETLAQEKLTGGMIKNVLLAAARLAAAADAKTVDKLYFDKAMARIKASENKMGTRGQNGGNVGVVDYVMAGDSTGT